MVALLTFNLPDLGVTDGVRSARVPRDGYARGWGLQFGDLAAKIEAEPLYKESLAAMGLPTWIIPPKRMNLYLLMTRFLPKLKERNIVEFGAFKGGNAIFMALVMREIDATARIYALDTFTGMPETDKSIDARNAGDFSDTSLAKLQLRIAELGLTNLIPVKGLFQDTFPAMAPNSKFALAHIDADIYSSIRYAQDAVWHRMTPGGYVVYDDAEVSSCIGATQAVEELIMDRRIHSEQIWPHFVFRVGLSASTE
jgi:predicted O-methyltransferase YrrM